MHEELVNYIVSNLTKGIPRPEIEKTLVASGWDIYSINQAFAKAEGISLDITTKNIQSTIVPEKGLFSILKKVTPYILLAVIGAAISLLLDKNLYYNMLSFPQLPQICTENIKSCNFPFAILSIIQTFTYLIAPGILLIAALRTNYKLAITVLFTVSLVRLLLVFRLFSFFTFDIFLIPTYQRYLSSLFMLLIFSLTYLFFHFKKTPAAFKASLLSLQIAIFAALLIVIPKITPPGQKIDAVVEILNSSPLAPKEIKEKIRAKKDYFANASRGQIETESALTPINACLSNKYKSSFPDSLTLKGKEYPKFSPDPKDGYLSPMSLASNLVTFGDGPEKIDVSLTRSSYAENFSIKSKVFEINFPGIEKILGDQVGFFIDKSNKQWSVEILVPSQVSLTFRSSYPANPNIGVADLKGLFYDWYNKACYPQL